MSTTPCHQVLYDVWLHGVRALCLGELILLVCREWAKTVGIWTCGESELSPLGCPGQACGAFLAVMLATLPGDAGGQGWGRGNTTCTPGTYEVGLCVRLSLRKDRVNDRQRSSPLSPSAWPWHSASTARWEPVSPWPRLHLRIAFLQHRWLKLAPALSSAATAAAHAESWSGKDAVRPGPWGMWVGRALLASGELGGLMEERCSRLLDLLAWADRPPWDDRGWGY